jgi:hypothetical protein
MSRPRWSYQVSAVSCQLWNRTLNVQLALLLLLDIDMTKPSIHEALARVASSNLL